MKLSFQIFVLICLLGFELPASGQDPKDQLRSFKEPSTELYVLTFLDPQCPISQKYTNPLNRMAEQYDKQKVRFYGIISVPKVTQVEIDSFVSQYRIGFQCVKDSRLEIGSSLNASVTPEVFLLDKRFSVIYSGAIDDWYFDLGRAKKNAESFFLRDAIDSYLRQQPVKTTRTDPVGCHISYSTLKSDK